MKLMFAALFVLLPGAAAAEAINLRCVGAASNIQANRSFGGFMMDGEFLITRTSDFAEVRSTETIVLEVASDRSSGRVMLPEAIIPGISVGRDRWWDIEKLEATDDVVRGRLELNPLNRPKLRLDRKTGKLELKGRSLAFRGDCTAGPGPTAGR